MENDSKAFALVPSNLPPPKQSASSPLEKVVEARLADRIRVLGGTSWKFVSINNRGVCDRIVLIDGRTIYVEVKRDKGKMSPLQHKFKQKVLANGGEFALVEGLEGVAVFIDRLKANRATWRTFHRATASMVKFFKGCVKCDN